MRTFLIETDERFATICRDIMQNQVECECDLDRKKICFFEKVALKGKHFTVTVVEYSFTLSGNILKC